MGEEADGAVEMPPDEAIEVMARQIHRNYVEAERRRGTEAGGGGSERNPLPALVPWDRLDEDLREQNRAQARDNVVKLHREGLRVVPADQGGDGAVLDEAVVERLARVEHDRWAEQKRQQGYRWGSSRDDAPPDLRHPDLLAWDELDESVRDKDREPVRQMPEVLAAAGYAAIPR